MSTITPESIPVFYTVGHTTGTTEDLKGLSFPTAYPPDVGPRTRLIAVCGITDDKGKASPKKDIRKRSKLKYAAQYGPDNDAPNIALHGKLIRLLKDRQKFSDEEIDNLYETLRYRLDALAPADELAKVRGVTNEAFNAYSFKRECWKRSKEEDKLDSFAWRLLVTKTIVDRPVEGHFWSKPAKCFSLLVWPCLG
ncbi:hypothetical protein ETB97_008945 [Aspergillus alliaceus]|uniref:Uncharacterized protein n=1 Tax=Petromyces alliaceus TaxID=209559 RepID=A0A8H6AAB0_PETAA|nr:hypothetical protein ETB97_008945 [Aspergillus burnettii]